MRADARARFLQEAQASAAPDDPAICTVYEINEADTRPFIVMAYVEGETLGERLRTRGPLLPAEASRVLREVAWALAYAHGRGIVHRDVKPANILLEDCDEIAVRLLDFGLEPTGTTSAKFGAIQKADAALWAPAVKASGFSPQQ